MNSITPNKIPLNIIVPVFLIFVGFSVFGILHHELWLDEAQHFLIARDSHSLRELATNMKYDGHVQLWNYLLFFITHYVSPNPLAMQVFHLVLINGAVWILLRYAPFPLVICLGILFGYYFLFEYSLVSRNYALGILMLFACCTLLQNAEKYMPAIACLCFLMMNTHLFFLFAAVSIYAIILLEVISRKSFQLSFYLFTFLVLAGLILAGIQMIQIPDDNTYFHPNKTTISYSSVVHPFYSMARGFFPVQAPREEHRFWNTYLFDRLPVVLKYIVALLAGMVPLFILAKSRKALIFYLMSAGLLALFLFLSQMIGNRYFGFYFIFFIAAGWIAANESPRFFSVAHVRYKKFIPAFMVIVILCQAGAGMYAYSQDIMHPFTTAKQTAEYIREKNMNDWPVVVSEYGSGPALSAYLGYPVYYVDTKQAGSYCIWKRSYFTRKSSPIIEKANDFDFLGSVKKFLLVKPVHAESTDIEDTFSLSELDSFTGGIIHADYFLYSVTRNVNVKAGHAAKAKQ